MNSFNRYTKAFLSVLIIGFSFAITSCNNPVGPEEEREHAAGAVLFLNGEEIVRVENTEVEGNITVAAGEETALVTVRFIAEDGDLFQPDESEHSLILEIANTAIAEIEKHPEDGEFSFHIVGKSEGSTTFSFELLHGDHADFTSPAIPITVTAN